MPDALRPLSTCVCKLELRSLRRSLWSAVTRHRFFGLADLSAKQRREERHTRITRSARLIACVRATALDGDKSPAQKR